MSETSGYDLSPPRRSPPASRPFLGCRFSDVFACVRLSSDAPAAHGRRL